MNRDQIQRLAVLAIETQDSVLLDHAAYLLHRLGHKHSLPRYMRMNPNTGEREYSDTPDFKNVTKRMDRDEFNRLYKGDWV
jgi:hypothetical protein